MVDRYFGGTPSRLGGVGLDELAEEVIRRHRYAYEGRRRAGALEIEVGGEYKWRREGEYHLFNPETVFKLQHATRAKRYDIFKEYTHARRRPVRPTWPPCAACCGCARDAALRPPVPLDEVEPVAAILKRFATGAMSYGSISAEAHETLAIAMNRLGGRSNTGEGGEDPDALHAGRQRRPPPQRHQAGGLGPLRGDERVPGQRRRHPDQDRPGRQARRGGPAPGAQGLPLDRQDPLLDPGRRASSPRRLTTTSTRSRTSPSSSTTSRTPTRRHGST